ncbi:MAG: thioredoxin domain-containing protein, partial [bacterium]
MARSTTAIFLLALLVGGCSGETASSEENLPEMDLAAFRNQLESSDRPAVVNVWASWCLPCREEAPL